MSALAMPPTADATSTWQEPGRQLGLPQERYVSRMKLAYALVGAAIFFLSASDITRWSLAVGPGAPPANVQTMMTVVDTISMVLLAAGILVVPTAKQRQPWIWSILGVFVTIGLFDAWLFYFPNYLTWLMSLSGGALTAVIWLSGIVSHLLVLLPFVAWLMARQRPARTYLLGLVFVALAPFLAADPSVLNFAFTEMFLQMLLAVGLAWVARSMARRLPEGSVSVVVGEPSPSVPTKTAPQPRQLGQVPPYNPLAILALIFGVLGGILGIVFGHMALGAIRRSGERGRELAIVAMVLGYAYLAAYLLGVLALLILAWR